MARTVRKFVSREFINTVDLELLRRLLEPYERTLALEWHELPAEDQARRDALFELFRMGEGFPAELQNALHYAKLLSGQAGARILFEQAELSGVELLTSHADPAIQPDTRSIALLAYLDHRSLFDGAVDRARLWATPRPLERCASRPGLRCRHDDLLCRAQFQEVVRQYFLKKYCGSYCDVRWYPEGDEIGILVLHGRYRKTANVEAEGGETTLSFHQIGEDTIRYCENTGLIKIGAGSQRDAKKLLECFAEHLLGEAKAFSHAMADTLYTLEPIRAAGEAYVFLTGWDADVAGVSVVELQVDDGRIMGRRRMSPWAMKLKDRQNAVKRLAEVVGEGGLSDIQLHSATLEFRLRGPGNAETTIPVLVQPPDIASFRDHTWEATIHDHLERNGLRRASLGASAPVAAE